jgi:hypothetical protein
MVKEFGLNSEEVFKLLVIMKIMKNLKNVAITNLIDRNECWIIEAQFEFAFRLSDLKKILIKRGTNRINKDYRKLVGGSLIPIMVRIYGTELTMHITENVETKYLYNVVVAWMGQEPNLIKIQICKIDPVREGMGHVLETKNRLWDGVYNFSLFEEIICRKRSNFPDYKFGSEENASIVINLAIMILHMCVNRFLKLTNLKEIIRRRYLKEYNMNPVFDDNMALPYLDEMKIEMFCCDQIHCYLLEKKMRTMKINYIGGSFKVPIHNYQTVDELTKKVCEIYSLGKDIILTDAERRIYSLRVILEYCQEEFWIGINCL